MQLDNPPSIIEAYTYDPVTNRYIYTNKVDEFNINYPIILTPKEYDELVLRESMRKYFKKNPTPSTGRRNRGSKKDLLPRYYINSGFLSRFW
jgi:cell surface protein SprA